MFPRTRLCASLMLAFGTAAGLALPAAAQTPTASPAPASTPQELERVEITGSAIRRVAAEGALPITTITRADIEKSGVTTVTDLIQRLPSMQGFTAVADSVNGGGGGTTTASLHALGSRYTLVLLNGRRVAPFNTGSTVNLESIPLSAIERVEVLLDGASALYGSDAIGGVVNFILRRNQTTGEVSVSADKVAKGGGETRSVSITKGFGDLDTDGFNLLGSLSFERQNALRAQQRDFAKSGIVRGIDGKNIGMRLFSSNSVPANVILRDPSGNPLGTFSPYLLANGECPAMHVVNGVDCRFDYASQVDLIPESQRSTGLLAGRLKIGADHQLFSELVLSRFHNTPTFAPPAQQGLVMTAAQFQQHVLPHLAALGLTPADVGSPSDADPNNDPTYNLRVFDAGGRRDKYSHDTVHWSVGGEGLFAGWDYKTALTLSRQKFVDKAAGGFLSNNRFQQLIADGTYDPIGMGPGEGAAALASAVLREELDRNVSTYNSFGLSASRPLFALGGGSASLALGGDVARQVFRNSPSLLLQSIGDAIIGGAGGALPFDTARRSYGVFSELLMPLTNELELTGSVRYDHYDAAVNRRRFDTDGAPLAGSREEGKAAGATTWKLSGRWQPSRSTLLRASLGTGFKAPTLSNITSPLQYAGVTSGTYDCPFAAPDPLAAGCQPPNSQYNMLAGGNASSGSDALKPEKSRQMSIGVAFEPTADTTVGMDLWRVQLKDQIGPLQEQIAFADPARFRSLFTLAVDPITGRQTLTLIQQPVNIGEVRNSGIDLNMTTRHTFGAGRLTTTLAGTYMLEAKYSVPGLPGFETSLGKFGVDNQAVFRWQLAGVATWDSGHWSTTLVGNVRSGYRDHEARCADPTLTAAECTEQGLWLGPEIRAVDPVTGEFGERIAYSRKVDAYVTFDLQTKYAVNKAFDVIVGVRNLFDKDPPFSMQDGGGGNMRGYDGRYANPLGRTWTLKANYRF